MQDLTPLFSYQLIYPESAGANAPTACWRRVHLSSVLREGEGANQASTRFLR